jgi:hypothetical protein
MRGEWISLSWHEAVVKMMATAKEDQEDSSPPSKEKKAR